MNEKKSLAASLAGAGVALVFCVSPLLALVLGGVGLSSWFGWVDSSFHLLFAVSVALGLRPSLLETYTVALFLKAISSWAYLIVILGFARRYLNRPAGFLSYGNRAVLPFYVLHQTVIVLIGYLILDWNPSLGVKFLALLLSSFATIMVIYHIGIRPFRTTQFLFGMKPAQRIRIPPFPL